MHVGLIVPSYDTRQPAGIPALATLAQGLAGRLDVTIFPTRLPDGPGQTLDKSVAVIAAGGAALPARALIRSVLAAIRDEHGRHPFDIIHGYWLFEPGLIAVLAGRLLGLPVVTSIGGAELAALPEIGYGGMRQRRGRLIHGGVLRASSLVTGGSSYVLDLARQALGADASTLRFAPLPVDSRAFEGELAAEIRPGAPNLLQVASFLPVKGQDLAIRAMPLVREQAPGTRLTMIGENPRGYRQRLADLSRDLGLRDAVEFVERVPHAELGRRYGAADLLLMPSRHESQGMVVLEAATAGLPAVGSDVGVVADLAPDAAVAVPRDDSLALADAIAALLADDGRRRELGELARRAVEARYAAAPAIERWLAVYAEALERK